MINFKNFVTKRRREVPEAGRRRDPFDEPGRGEERSSSVDRVGVGRGLRERAEGRYLERADFASNRITRETNRTILFFFVIACIN